MFKQVDLVLELLWMCGDIIRFANINGTVTASGNIIEVTGNTTTSASYSELERKWHALFVGAEHEGRAVVEMNSDTAVGKSITHAILIAVVNPRHDEDFIV